MRINPYLGFNGQCEVAFKFYEQCLGGKIESMSTWAGTPAAAQAPPEWQNKILHARMTVGENVLMGSDNPPGHYQQPAGMWVSLLLQDPAEAERVFHALAENGKVQMPIQKTFWSAAFGMLVDQFGIPWLINCDQAG